MKKINLDKVESIFKDMNNEKAQIGLSLLKELQFCNETLEKLKEKIQEDGVVTEMCQGEYYITRENPALRSYNTTMKNYQTLTKQIVELIPSKVNVNDDFDSFGE